MTSFLEQQTDFIMIFLHLKYLMFEVVIFLLKIECCAYLYSTFLFYIHGYLYFTCFIFLFIKFVFIILIVEVIRMKKIVISNIMKYIKKRTNYNNQQLLEIEYGLTGIYLTISKLIIIFVIAIFLGLVKYLLIFMIFFNIIRTTAFGLHATKSWICLLSSTLIFIGIPILCKYLLLNYFIKVIIGIICIFLIYKNAPADTKKRPIVNLRRRFILNSISIFISVIFVIISLLVHDNYISNCLLFSLILENFLISPMIYKLFNLSYNNYIDFLKSHPDFNS